MFGQRLYAEPTPPAREHRGCKSAPKVYDRPTFGHVTNSQWQYGVKIIRDSDWIKVT
jgi:hypothetical protein